MRKNVFRGAIFDLDGVITQTAQLHFMAWKKTFDDYLERLSEKENRPFMPFTHEESYVPYVDGKPRYQGVKSFLESRDIHIPFGKPGDSPALETVCGIGNRKNRLFKKYINKKGAEVYPSTIKLVKQMKKKGIKLAVASSSKNCRYILEKTGLIDLFDFVIGGVISKEIGLRGKPKPDIFVIAADNIGLTAHECIMVEDALAGVEAGKNGNFGLVVGVARKGDKDSLYARGADIVVSDLHELPLSTIEKWFRTGIEHDSWHITFHEFDPAREKLRETLTSVGNGYYGTRGCFFGEKDRDDIHYPGTYIAGVYNSLPTEIHGKIIHNNDLVNCPNWLYTEIRIDNGTILRPLDMEILDYRQQLDMRNAVVSREMRLRDNKGRITQLTTQRYASMAHPHLAALRITLKPENYSLPVTVRSCLDGTIINNGVPRYRALNSRHLEPVREEETKKGIMLEVSTLTSQISLRMQAQTIVYSHRKLCSETVAVEKKKGFIAQTFHFNVVEHTTYTIDKIVEIDTSKDGKKEHENEIDKLTLYDDLYSNHTKTWKKLWYSADVIIEGDRFTQKAVRLHTYHLLSTASIHNHLLDTSIPARGLTGEAYRGHIFWDELFVLPFFNVRFPAITRSLLMYRYRRLDGARKNAKENGFTGAMYPWQTADGGNEETQVIHYNPVSGTWDPDLSRNQRHISIAVAYNVWEYVYCTGDLSFLHDYGAEIMVEIARFWSSSATYDKKNDRYHINGVMGPDEFHEKYPGRKKGGINDNAYTNIMVSWLMHKTIEMIEHLPDNVITRLCQKTGFDLAETKRWRNIVRKMAVVITPDGIVSQFDGFMKLKDLDWETYYQKYGDIHRLDRILKSEGDSPDRYKLIKQADVLMTYYLLSPEQVAHILAFMGYSVHDPRTFMKNNYDYYSTITTHGSTLSYVVHSAILKYLKRHKSDMCKWHRRALASDLTDIQNGTTSEGIHCGVMGGTLDIIVKSLAGINLFKEQISIDPCLPDSYESLSFRFVHRGSRFQLTIMKKDITILLEKAGKKDLMISVKGRRYMIKKGEQLKIPYRAK